MDNGVTVWGCECGKGCRKKVELPIGEAERIRKGGYVLVVKGCSLPVGEKGLKVVGGGRNYSLLEVMG